MSNKARLIEAFDKCQETFDVWQEAETELVAVRSRVCDAQNAYTGAKRHWEHTLKEISPGIKSQEPTFEEHGG